MDIERSCRRYGLSHSVETKKRTLFSSIWPSDKIPEDWRQRFKKGQPAKAEHHQSIEGRRVKQSLLPCPMQQQLRFVCAYKNSKKKKKKKKEDRDSSQETHYTVYKKEVCVAKKDCSRTPIYFLAVNVLTVK